ncbi:hypothetical protein ACK3TF_003489 [Chlorella vulgaris]
MAFRHLVVVLLALAACQPTQVDGFSIVNLVLSKAGDVAKYVLEKGVDGASNFVADRLEEAGEADAANDIRQVGDLIEENIGLAVDATACAGSVAAGAGIVSAISALATPACINTATGVFSLVSDAVDNDGGQACPEGAIPISDAASCVEHCESVSPDCSSWYWDHGCCLCKSYCDNVPGGTETYTPPTTDSTTSCSPDVQYNVDFWGADIVPVTTKWADTAVSAASPEDCCEACSLYDFCEAWTFAAGSNCKERFPNAPGCCFLKKGSGYEVRSAPGMISGTTNTPPPAQCSLEFDTDLTGGDLLTADGFDTVVATISDVTCCNSCAQTPGCGAWTMTPPSFCQDRLDGPAVGCCFLKTSSGWTATKDDQGVMTSGVLLSR